MSIFNQAASNETYAKIAGKSFVPEGVDPLISAAPIPIRSELWGKFLITAYEWKDGSSGLAFTNGKASFHIDNNNNLIFSAGEPSQGGCGGKMITNTIEKLEKSQSVAIEVSGKPDGGIKSTDEGKDGNIEETEEPAYSLKVYGNVCVEALGGEVVLKGDNVTINAANTLNLNSGKDINIQAGQNGGNINLTAGTIKMDGSFLKKKITGGEYADGTAEIQTDQIKPGSSNVINSVGNIKYAITGDYELGTTGDYKLGVLGNYHTDVTLDYGLNVKKNMSTLVSGKSKLEVQGVVSEKQNKTSNYEIIIGPAASGASKELPTFKVNSGGPIGLEALLGGFKLTSGAKAVSEFSFDEKEGSWRVGSKLGYLSMGPKDVELGYIKTSKLTLSAVSASLTAPAIFLN